MRRKGVSLGFFTFMTAFVVAGAMANNLMFNQYVGSLESNIESASQNHFDDFGRREEVLNADCITRRRGVFIKSKIEDNSDALTCISTAEEPFIAAFYWPERDHMFSYKITPQGPGEPSDVSQAWLDRSLDDVLDQATTKETYPITVYDDDSGDYYQGMLILSR